MIKRLGLEHPAHQVDESVKEYYYRVKAFHARRKTQDGDILGDFVKRLLPGYREYVVTKLSPQSELRDAYDKALMYEGLVKTGIVPKLPAITGPTIGVIDPQPLTMAAMNQGTTQGTTMIQPTLVKPQSEGNTAIKSGMIVLAEAIDKLTASDKEQKKEVQRLQGLLKGRNPQGPPRNPPQQAQGMGGYEPWRAPYCNTCQTYGHPTEYCSRQPWGQNVPPPPPQQPQYSQPRFSRSYSQPAQGQYNRQNNGGSTSWRGGRGGQRNNYQGNNPQGQSQPIVRDRPPPQPSGNIASPNPSGMDNKYRQSPEN